MSCKFEVTLKDLRKAGACYTGYNKVVRALQGESFTEEDNDRNSYLTHKNDKPISLLSILESNGLDDVLWALRCVSGSEKDVRLFAVACARKVQHLMDDRRSIAAMDVAERFAYGTATVDDLNAARAAAGNAAWDAAWATVWDADRAARDAAWAAAGNAAWAAAGNAARADQTQLFIDMCNGVAPWQIGKAVKESNDEA